MLCYILSYSRESTFLVTSIIKVDSEVNRTYLRKFFVFWYTKSYGKQVWYTAGVLLKKNAVDQNNSSLFSSLGRISRAIMASFAKIYTAEVK